MKDMKTVCTVSVALFVAVLLLTAPFAKAANEDSAQVSKLLSDAKAQAYQLSEDAAQMYSFTQVTHGVSWEGHADAITQIKEDVNRLAKQLTKLNDARNEGSDWQKTAIDRIAPMLKELASNTTAVIDRLNKNPKGINSDAYKDYLEANADESAHLSRLISDFVDYGKTKKRLETVTGRLELQTKD